MMVVTSDLGGEYFDVICDCGNAKKVLKRQAVYGSTKSCGCLQRRVNTDRLTVHGLSRHPLYKTLENMKSRCYNKMATGYKDYGGRGILICEEWVRDFRSFYNFAMSNGWREGLHIDRIDNDGNYEPSNCQFITNAENQAIGKKRMQSNNKSGIVGVLQLSHGAWNSRIKTADGVLTRNFKTKEEAIAQRVAWEREFL